MSAILWWSIGGYLGLGSIIYLISIVRAGRFISTDPRFADLTQTELVEVIAPIALKTSWLIVFWLPFLVLSALVTRPRKATATQKDATT